MDKIALGKVVHDGVPRLVERMRDECRVLAELRHPHVVQLIEVFEAPQHLFIIMEAAPGGALLERILERGW